jgi:type I restriction enzyme S subunit
VEVSGEGLPRNWLLTTVGQVGAIRLGRQRSPANTTGRFPTKYIRAANITLRGFDLADILEMDFTPEERAIYRLLLDDILLVEGSGSADQVGRAAIWRDQIPDCCYQNTVIRFRPHAATAQYSLIVFRHLRASGAFGQTARGVGILHLGASRLADLPFPLPPLREQTRIAEVAEQRSRELSEAESALQSALGKMKERDLEILAQAAGGRLTYGDGDATVANADVSADLNGTRTSAAAAYDGISAYGWAKELPRDWTWVRVGDIAEVRLGRMRSPEYSHGPNMRPYLRVANVLEDRIDTSDIMEMNFSPEEYEIYALRPGDILLNDGQSPELVGRPAIYRGEISGACYQNHLIRFRASSAVNPEFAVLVFRHYLHARRFRDAARWTTNIATLSLKRFSDLPFPLPPLPEQARIAEEARRLLNESANQQAAVRQSLSRLPEMETELLAMAVSGALVPPENTSESAAELLDRLGTPPKEKAATRSRSRRRPEEGPHMPQRPDRGRRPSVNSLPGVLSRQGVPLPLPELFRLVGFDKDKPSDVEEFYVELREELGRSIRMTGGDQENALVEAIDDEAH